MFSHQSDTILGDAEEGLAPMGRWGGPPEYRHLRWTLNNEPVEGVGRNQVGRTVVRSQPHGSITGSSGENRSQIVGVKSIDG